ncbi:SURF1 family protein [Achromobacter sp. GG226]|uniref:SURF1 family protein n=1 Tax=Verticiella alkaliphila TaxID=2779529 RepID=UPI001C0B35F0|nr:SURF1 family protein [Verticiella sp. GG226]MBU4612493.1 SURF1 family protein [Verticiella sp. GG226]
MTSSPAATDAPARRPRRAGVLAAWAIVALAVFAYLISLGIWQVERRAWKLDLIDRVESRIHAAPAPLPSPADWPRVNRDDDEYRRVTAAGEYLHAEEALVQATTALGAGFWVLTPLRQADGSIVFVNRGFVPSDRTRPETRRANQPEGTVQVTGLLRIPEPGGGFLRKNDPVANAWYSRDVAAIGESRGLASVAPFFVDAEWPRPPAMGDVREPDYPVGGLTVVAFNNHHTIYAITWFGLAMMLALGAGLLARDEYRLRQRRKATLAATGDRHDDRPH